MSEKEWLKTFSENLRSMLSEYGVTQGELAEKCNLSEATISYYISGRRMPGPKAIINIAYVLDCGIDDLIDFGCMID